MTDNDKQNSTAEYTN